MQSSWSSRQIYTTRTNVEAANFLEMYYVIIRRTRNGDMADMYMYVFRRIVGRPGECVRACVRASTGKNFSTPWPESNIYEMDLAIVICSRIAAHWWRISRDYHLEIEMQPSIHRSSQPASGRTAMSLFILELKFALCPFLNSFFVLS